MPYELYKREHKQNRTLKLLILTENSFGPLIHEALCKSFDFIVPKISIGRGRIQALFEIGCRF